MADKFYAATRIQHGELKEDGSQEGKNVTKVFEVDDEVTGLDKETMQDLWRAGALRREQGSTGKDATPSADNPEGDPNKQDDNTGTPVRRADGKFAKPGDENPK
jgi:hypothetical protein